MRLILILLLILAVVAVGTGLAGGFYAEAQQLWYSGGAALAGAIALILLII